MQDTKHAPARIAQHAPTTPADIAALPVIVWNTGRWYGDEGQRIAAITLPDGRLVFNDYDRNIDGVIDPLPAQSATVTPRAIAEHVMREYDHGRYRSIYTLDSLPISLLALRHALQDAAVPPAPPARLITQLYPNASSANEAGGRAYHDALVEARAICGKGCYASRGRFVAVYLANGNVAPDCEAEAHPWRGTREHYMELRDRIAADPAITRIQITGGINYAASVRDWADFNYDPHVVDWEIDLFIATPL